MGDFRGFCGVANVAVIDPTAARPLPTNVPLARALLHSARKEHSMRRLLIALSLASPAPLRAQVMEDFDLLDRRIAVALGGTAADAGLFAQPVDRRVRLARCTEPVTIDPPALGAVAVRCASLGWRMRVPLIGRGPAQTGELLVHRGDTVELVYGGAGFDLVTTATAMEDGRLGAPIRVKSPTGIANLTGRVRGPGSVVIAD
jgi:flagellar basal body P-ring formation protein FlgA